MVFSARDFLLQHVPHFLLSTTLHRVQNEPMAPSAVKGFPLPSWTFSREDENGEKMPQIIAHRGSKIDFPENTMAAFKAAVKTGVHALETDIHITRDGVAVLCHDPTLLRCFGVDKRVENCDWEFISTLRTLREPHEPMPRLVDLLEYLATEELEHVWLLLDIKIDVDPTLSLGTIAKALEDTAPHPRRSWKDRVVLGVWALKYLSLCEKLLQGYPVMHIGFSTTYASLFMSYPNVCFNLFAKKLALRWVGSRFIRKAHNNNRSVIAWTVNTAPLMRWCIKEGLDGVITDDPRRLIEVQKLWREGVRKVDFTWKDTAWSLLFNFWSLFINTFVIKCWIKSRQRRKVS